MAAYHAYANQLVSAPLEKDDFAAKYETIIKIGRTNGYTKKTIEKVLTKHIRKQSLRETTTLSAANDPEQHRSDSRQRAF